MGVCYGHSARDIQDAISPEVPVFGSSSIDDEDIDISCKRSACVSRAEIELVTFARKLVAVSAIKDVVQAECAAQIITILCLEGV